MSEDWFATVLSSENLTIIINFCSRTRLQSEEIVAELVTSFLLPEVQKITMRENGKPDVTRFLPKTKSFLSL